MLIICILVLTKLFINNLFMQGLCTFVAALLHYLFTAVFFWMLCEGIMLYLMLVVVFSGGSKKWWIFFILGWGSWFTGHLYLRVYLCHYTALSIQTYKFVLHASIHSYLLCRWSNSASSYISGSNQ